MENTRWAREVSEKIKNKMKLVAKRNEYKIPYTTINGRYDDQTETNICWWTNGFWGGMMWQLYHATSDEMYKTIALRNEKELDRNLMMSQGMDHDSGFKWLTTAVAHYRVSGNLDSKNRGVLAADNLLGRYNLAGKYIRAWNDGGDGSKAGWAIIDCMMNLPLLYWAYKETMDPRYLLVAEKHAETVMKFFVRENGSVKHIVEFDPLSGMYMKSHGGQGFANGSSWTRGQAWAIYGFALSFVNTKNSLYLDYAKKIADYFILNIPKSSYIPVDFRQPLDCALEDSSAAAIAACGLLEIAKHEKQNESIYFDVALRLLKTLELTRCDWTDSKDNILEKCTAAFHDNNHEFSIIYGDYFFIEAIWKLTGEELFIW